MFQLKKVMVRFAESDHDRAQRVYEQRCAEEKASRGTRRERWQRIVDELAQEGQQAIDAYESHTWKLQKQASCLNDFDAVGIRWRILEEAKQQLQEQNK